MNKFLLIQGLSLMMIMNTTAQILCIYCYDQNGVISSPVNNLLLNGGFESGCWGGGYFCPNSTAHNCDFPNWTCTGGDTLTYANAMGPSGSVIPEGVLGAYFGNNYCHACSQIFDDTSCINNVSCTVTGIPPGYPVSVNPGYGGTTGVSIEQTVNGLVPGNTYVLEFWAGGEYNTVSPFPLPGVFAVDIGFGDTLLRCKATYPSVGIGTRYIIQFNATSSSHTIKFTNWGHICYYCTELVIDDVRLYTIAELAPKVPDCILGINVPSLNAINIYPNPFSNELNIETDRNEPSEIILYDITLRKLLHQKFTNALIFNTEKLSKGIYFYDVSNKNGVVKKGKVVKD